MIYEKHSNNKKLALLILSAGYSSRMHGFKPLLPLNNTTVIEYIIDNFKSCGINDIYVVTGHNSLLISEKLKDPDVKIVYNPKYDEGMYSSVIAGIEAFPKDIDGFLMLPVDIPNISKNTINSLCQIFQNESFDIIYPSYNNRRGHPPIISSNLFEGIRSYNGDGGLKKLLKNYQDNIYHLNTLDEGILFDIDTREDYNKLIEKISS